ncbi:4Fe-4S ferredoxin [Chitinispirillum alkaliphilum]|nr:4Fe-4S ferredoxin [Chitinispirillum alkaliphilum]
MALKVEKNKCVGCGICIKVCPEPYVIKKEDDRKVSINEMRCKVCLLCASVCPKKAIEKQDGQS